MSDIITFADEIRILREEKNLTRQDVCSWLRIPYRTYQNWELGIRIPTITVQRMVKNQMEDFPRKFV